MTPENNEQVIDFNIGSKGDWERGREGERERGRGRGKEGGRERKGGREERRHVCMYMYITLLTISASLIAASSSLPIIIK